MNIEEFQNWNKEFYNKRSWDEYNSFIRMNFLCEEVGELSQAIRKYEIGRDRPDEEEKSRSENMQGIKEEIGDVIDNITVLINKYDLSLEEILENHIKKIESRFE
ncbi:MazG nucleotide pyrophosphohydrolase domain-containing protein [Anaerococcus sp. DFU013_CI05]|uniref:MazG nucleotide pyrophosphohydrolase domain-containing protein n=1 Tax=Anaerococcus sp. AH8042_DFU013_CI05 TaxID=3385202 RepID=UPI003A52333F